MAYTKFPSTSDTDFPTTSKTNFPTTSKTNFPSHSGKTNFPGSSSSSVTQLWTLVSSVTCLRAWQSDFGITMGGTPLASGTTPPAVTLTGSASTNPALRMEIQATGARGASTFRYGAANTGTTSTWIEQNVTTAATYAAIGALSGVTFNFPVGTYTSDNVYEGVCSSWTDQKNSTTATQGTPAKQPRILVQAGTGLALRFDGSNDSLLESTLDLPAPNVTPTFVYFVGRQISWTINHVVFDCGPGTEGITLFTTTVSNRLSQYCGAAVNESLGATIGSLIRGWASFTGSTSDGLKLGSATEVTGASAGTANPSAGIRLGAALNDTVPANWDIVVAFYFNGRPTPAELTAMDTAAGSLYSGLVV